MIVQANGTGYQVTGVGTTRTSDGSGAQSFDFSLVSGSDQFDLGSALAWKDGSNGTNNMGVPEFTNAGPGLVGWFGDGITNFAPGDSLDVAGNFARTYSYRGTLTPGDGELVGNVLSTRGFANDTASGSIFILNDPFTESGTFTRWGVFDDDTAGRQITPLLLQPSGGDWEVVGIGATQTSSGTGAQYFDFSPVSGTDQAGSEIYFGWKDGSNGSNSEGLVDFDVPTGGPEVIWLGAGQTSFAEGDVLSEAGRFDRTYSISAFSSFVPPPETLTVGNDLTGRTLQDTASGSIFVLTQESAAGTLSEIGFYDDDFAGRELTPLILRANGTSYEITGVGATRTSDGSGPQTFDFELVDGSDEFGLGSALAWKDGSNGTDNQGVPEFTNAGPGTVAWFGAGNTNFALGDSLDVTGSFTRTYSYQGTLQPGDGELVGNVVANREFANDTAVGSIFVLDDPFSELGTLSQWVAYDDDTAGREITPLLLQRNGDNWEVIGIGATQISDGTGAQYFEFSLVSGTDQVGDGVYFGWKDGSNGGNSQGLVDWQTLTGGPGVVWFGPNNTTFAPGDLLSEAGRFERTYSISAFATSPTVIPEPVSLATFGLCISSVSLIRRRAK